MCVNWPITGRLDWRGQEQGMSGFLATKMGIGLEQAEAGQEWREG